MAKKKQVKKDDNKNKKRKGLLIFFIILSILALAGIGVLVFFLLKSCGNKPEPTPPTEEYTVTVHQPATPETAGWVVKANGNTGSFKAAPGTLIDVTAEQVAASAYFLSSNIDQKYQIDVAYTKESGEIGHLNFPFNWDESQGIYEGQFSMLKSDIDINIVGRDDIEDYIYVKLPDEEQPSQYKNWIIDDNTVYNPDKDLLLIEEESFFGGSPKTQTKTRNDFNEDVYVGANIKNLQDNFLTKCSKYNKNLTFNPNPKTPELPNTTLTVIGVGFLSECKQFNTEFTLPSSVWLIAGDFMMDCSGFNKKLDLSNVQYLHLGATSVTTFLLNCTSFNSEIKFEKLVEVPPCFMNFCTSFNKPLTIPNTVKAIGYSFMYNCNSMWNTITLNCDKSAIKNPYDYHTCSVNDAGLPSFYNGIKIAGPCASDFINAFPYISQPASGHEEAIYRNLILA